MTFRAFFFFFKNFFLYILKIPLPQNKRNESLNFEGAQTWSSHYPIQFGIYWKLIRWPSFKGFKSLTLTKFCKIEVQAKAISQLFLWWWILIFCFEIIHNSCVMDFWMFNIYLFSLHDTTKKDVKILYINKSGNLFVFHVLD